MHDTEDRRWWYAFGEQEEFAFIALLKSYGVDVRRNPAKAVDRTTPDLLIKGRLSDVKAQRTPFFTAFQYGLPAQYTVRFNRKDYERYAERWPHIWLYFWIRWDTCTWQDLVVPHVDDVFAIPFVRLRTLVANAPEHFYDRRKTDPRANAKSSFLLDARDMASLREWSVNAHYEQIDLI